MVNSTLGIFLNCRWRGAEGDGPVVDAGIVQLDMNAVGLASKQYLESNTSCYWKYDLYNHFIGLGYTVDVCRERY